MMKQSRLVRISLQRLAGRVTVGTVTVGSVGLGLVGKENVGKRGRVGRVGRVKAGMVNLGGIVMGGSVRQSSISMGGGLIASVTYKTGMDSSAIFLCFLYAYYITLLAILTTKAYMLAILSINAVYQCIHVYNRLSNNDKILSVYMYLVHFKL